MGSEEDPKTCEGKKQQLSHKQTINLLLLATELDAKIDGIAFNIEIIYTR
jgi:hypothetical protein